MIGGDPTDAAVPCVLGVVGLHEGEVEHWSRNDEGDIEVSVIAHAHGSPLRALLHGTGGRGLGVWCIPPIGTEVAVVFPDGDFQGVPILFGGGGAPESLDGSTIVIVVPSGGKVKIMSDGGTPSPVATLADLQAHRSWDATHTHTAPGGGGVTTAPLTTPPTPSGTTVGEIE